MMPSKTRTSGAIGIVLLTLTALPAGVVAQQGAVDTASPLTIEELALEQSRIADRYVRLEQLLIRMAELEASSNPQRAALLKRAAQQSAERLTRSQLNTLIGLLTPPAQLNRAIQEQQAVLTDLQQLLQLLLSENRSDRLKEEAERIKEYIKEVERLLRLENSLEGRTRGQGDPKDLAEEQARVAERAGRLADQIAENEGAGSQAADPESSPQNPSEANDDNPNPDESPDSDPEGDVDSDDGDEPDPMPNDGKQESSSKSGQQSEGQQSEGQQSEGQQSEGQQSEGQQSEGQQSEGQQSEGQQPQQNPAQQRVREAQRRMREAQKRLEKAERDEAIVEQEQARRELERAKAELEQILRQLREEEIERVLVGLEERFARMLESQLRIYESTQELHKIDIADRDRTVDIQAGKLSFEESKLVLEADRALTLLREEGSSVAFPESVEQMRDEMEFVSDRLSKVKVDELTLGAEEEIIAALEEMIAAFRQAQKELEERQQQQQQQQQQQGDPQDMPLVDQLAELKMIRALQMRVNTRTQRCARLLTDLDDPVGQATDEELQIVLTKLAERQRRIHEVTRDIVVGKNQ